MRSFWARLFLSSILESGRSVEFLQNSEFFFNSRPGKKLGKHQHTYDQYDPTYAILNKCEVKGRVHCFSKQVVTNKCLLLNPEKKN